MSWRFRITSVDYEPRDLAAQLPFEGSLLRRIAGADRPDYWLAELTQPLSWNDQGAARQVTHVVLAARYQGQAIEPGFQRLAVGIAFVKDPTLLQDASLDFTKCHYAAIGVAEGVAEDGAVPAS